MRRILLYAFTAALLPLLAVEYYARQRFASYVDCDYYLREVAFPRLLNSLVTAPPTHLPARRYGFALTPHATRTITRPEYTYTIHSNSLGFRSRELEPKRAGEYRLLLFGDSMLFGVGAPEEETIASQLERRARADGAELRVYNYSMLAFSTVQALIAARTHAAEAEPDHLLLGVFIANDLLANVVETIDAEGNLAYDASAEAELRAALEAHLAPLLPSVALRALALNAWVPRLRYQLSAEPRYLRHTYALLDEFAALAAALGARFSLVVIYPRYAVAGGLLARWSQSRAPGALLAAYGRAHHIATIDLIDYVHGAADAERYYYADDGHFNARGNARIAQILYENLIETVVEQ